jgi:ketosteroid isomerase-like protein
VSLGRSWGDGPRTNREVVQEGYAHFNRRDLDGVVAHLDPAIRWSDAEDVPDARTYEGIDEVRSFLESFERHWTKLRFEPRELREAGDMVVAYCNLTGRGRASGAEVDAEVIHIWRLRDLRVVSVSTFFDPEEAAKAALIDGPARE